MLSVDGGATDAAGDLACAGVDSQCGAAAGELDAVIDRAARAQFDDAVELDVDNTAGHRGENLRHTELGGGDIPLRVLDRAVDLHDAAEARADRAVVAVGNGVTAGIEDQRAVR